jgi:LemA protein
LITFGDLECHIDRYFKLASQLTIDKTIVIFVFYIIMNKLTISALILVVSILVGFISFYFYSASVRDSAVKNQETVNEAWGNVQSAYQRRADLIGNLVETVRAAAENEREILVGVTEARGGIRHYTDSIGNLVAEQSAKVKSATTPAELQQSDVMLMNTYRGFRGFMTENYPTVQSTQNFANLQTQLEGTENRINTERNRYNEAVKTYNAHIRGTFKKMGLSLVASEEDNFKVREMFEAKEGAEEAPKVKF